MSIEEVVVEHLRTLPPDRQKEVLDFVEFLHERAGKKVPKQSPEGLWTDLNVAITDEDIVDVRREMWGTFPREDV